jgi:hypothetical protein
LVTYTADKFNFGKFKSGGLHEKHAVGTWSSATMSRVLLDLRSQRWLWGVLAFCFFLVSCMANFFILMIESVRSSETSLNCYWTTQCYASEDNTLCQYLLQYRKTKKVCRGDLPDVYILLASIQENKSIRSLQRILLY